MCRRWARLFPGRETCATAGISTKKKRYAIMVYDNEGFREDSEGKRGKVKAMGLDRKRSDTPDFMQNYLWNYWCLQSYWWYRRSWVIDRTKEFRTAFPERPWLGKKAPNVLTTCTKHTKVYEKTGKCSIGHALINWNKMLKVNSDAYSLLTTDGMKTIVCKLKDNP